MQLLADFHEQSATSDAFRMSTFSACRQRSFRNCNLQINECYSVYIQIIIYLPKSVLFLKFFLVLCNHCCCFSLKPERTQIKTSRNLVSIALTLPFCVIKLNFKAKIAMLNSATKTIWDTPGVVPPITVGKVHMKFAFLHP